MDYEKKYKDALERARIWKNKSGMPKYRQGILDDIFPELKESEDEKIKETLIDYFKIYKKQEECGIKTFFGIPTDNIIAWLEKQGEQKVPINDFKAKNWYVSELDGKIHDMTYNPADKVKPKFKVVEYVYILDYCSGRVMVVKHNLVEPISELFEQLGLKENQCQYMVSDKILSIEYINF